MYVRYTLMCHLEHNKLFKLIYSKIDSVGVICFKLVEFDMKVFCYKGKCFIKYASVVKTMKQI